MKAMHGPSTPWGTIKIVDDARISQPRRAAAVSVAFQGIRGAKAGENGYC